jgi:hypothetical protein
MNLGWKRVGAGSVASLMALGGLLAVAGGHGMASCLRTAAIQPEVTVGEAAGVLVFYVLSGGCAAATAVNYTVLGGTSTPGADFVLSAGQLTWATGDKTPRAIVADVVDDRASEASLEDFSVTLTGQGHNILVVQGIGSGRILDDDRPGLDWGVDGQFCLPDDPVSGAGKSSQVIYVCDDDLRPDPYVPVALSEPLPAPAVLDWETEDGTAVAGTDFVGVSAETPVAARATKVFLPVQLLPSAPGAPTRWFTVRIRGVSLGTVVDATAIVVIGGS